jgi:predicted DNA-binding transcriptional regulator YafY
MPKNSNQKLRLLYVMRLLLENTDEQHTMTLSELGERLAQYGISFERKSLYSDIETLRQFGVDIILTKGSHFGYFVVNRTFELPELKLLMDAVQSSRFITAKKSVQLISKLESLVSVYEASKLKRQVFITGRVKAPNESIYYSIDKLYEAIAANRKVSFKYYEYTLSKKMRFRRNGHDYVVSPYALHWDGDNYYLICHNPERGIAHFRVDKISTITDVDEDRTPMDENLDLAQYAKRTFAMFTGADETVTVRFANDLIGVVIDRFGSDIAIQKTDDEHFAAELPVNVSQTFLSWIFQFGPQAQITAPAAVVEQMQQRVRELHAVYGPEN